MLRPDEHDLIEVRPDERLDEARLHSYLRGKLPGTEEALTRQAICWRKSESDLSAAVRRAV